MIIHVYSAKVCKLVHCQKKKKQEATRHIYHLKVTEKLELTLEQVYTTSVIQFHFSKYCLCQLSAASVRKYNNGGISCISKCLDAPHSLHLPGSPSSSAANSGFPPYEYLGKEATISSKHQVNAVCNTNICFTHLV